MPREKLRGDAESPKLEADAETEDVKRVEFGRVARTEVEHLRVLSVHVVARLHLHRYHSHDQFAMHCAVGVGLGDFTIANVSSLMIE